MRGYAGKMLWVDLSRAKLEDEALDEGLCRQFIGGYGLGARILFSRQKAGVDPLGPDNILGFTTGMLTGTPSISASRYIVVGKSPLTGGWGDANSGGNFGPYLKFAGYDNIFFSGIAEKPVYLFINNGKAELRDAAHLTGKDTFQTEDILKGELGKDVEVACIGPAGEKVARIAAVMNNKGRAAGRSGLGAVMGSKKLKAIAVKGNMKIPMADATRANELRKKYLKELSGHVDMLRDNGTPGIFIDCAESGDTPTKNWSGTAVIDFPDYKDIGGDPVLKRQEKRYACWRCPIGCGGHMREGRGEYKYEAGAHKPEYETLGMFGADCLNSSVESIIKLNDICNRYGVDTISAGATMAFAIECSARGSITNAATDGLEMTWGNHKSIVAMTEKMVRREGFGDILADGVKVAAGRIGGDASSYAMHIQGQEIPAHDPKFGYHWATTYRMDATPARHTQGPGLPMPGMDLPEHDEKAFSGRAEAHKLGSDFSHVVSCTGTCIFGFWALPDVDAFIDFMNAVSGWDFTREEIFKTGERIANMRQAFNIREGLNPLKYKIPGRIYGHPAPTQGPLAGVTVDEDTLYSEYLTAMDWDTRTTKPTKQKLLELGLEDVAKALWP
ncbi:MAG: aldehyde ferredoxin oxidoreductase [Dehalococcoidia bacterium]|nr:MAG: aldehyde ferredoxin oxidoreductase [Dehalococcoidia bacterium]